LIPFDEITSSQNVISGIDTNGFGRTQFIWSKPMSTKCLCLCGNDNLDFWYSRSSGPLSNYDGVKGEK